MSGDAAEEATISLVMRQTDYGREEAIEALSKHNGDPSLVIRDYLTDGAKPTVANERKAPTSTNQRVYSEIRGYMDVNAQAYRKKNSSA